MTSCLRGRLEDFLLPQVVTLVEVVQSSGHLEVVGPEGRGELAFRRGQIVEARLGARTGELAAYLILSWSTGEFCFTRSAAEPEGEMGHSNQALCLEAMRLLDESGSVGLRFTPSSPAPQPAIEGERSVAEAMLGGARTVREIAEAAGMSRLEAYYQLEQLERAGRVARAVTAGAVRRDGPPDAIRVLVVDDSEFMRRTLIRLFEADPLLKVVGSASSGMEALALLGSTKPDVISLDLHMPEMDGVTTLKRIMLSDPTPTVIVTASSPESLELTFETILRFGAIDFITKPSRSRGDIGEQSRYMLRRLHNAARVNLRGVRLFQPPLAAAPRRARPGECRGLVVAVAGTGACLSLMQMLSSLPADLPYGLLAMLPIPEDFLTAFVTYMNRYSAFRVEAASDGALLASGVCHLTSCRSGLRIVASTEGARLRADSAAGPCDPNLLLYDASHLFHEHAVGLVLSGEPRDLGGGLAAVRSVGGTTMAQIPETCVDPEGPADALARGLVDKPTVLDRISRDLSQSFIDRLVRSRAAGRMSQGGDQWPRRSA